MGRWTKCYSDGSQYVGTDKDVSQKRASWRKSRQDSIVCVDLEHDNIRLHMTGFGEYWQSDSYVSTPYNQILTHRQIMRHITEGDLFYQIKRTENTCSVNIAQFFFDPGHELIPIEWIGKWIVLEYDVQKKHINHFIRDDKY